MMVDHGCEHYQTIACRYQPSAMTHLPSLRILMANHYTPSSSMINFYPGDQPVANPH